MYYVVLLGMVKNGGGCVINIVFDVGCVGLFGEVVYLVCKGGIILFIKIVVCELVCKGI